MKQFLRETFCPGEALPIRRRLKRIERRQNIIVSLLLTAITWGTVQRCGIKHTAERGISQNETLLKNDSVAERQRMEISRKTSESLKYRLDSINQVKP